jgi:hypothetical protein
MEAIMYTTDDQGILNNYAVEPTVYLAAYPSFEQQKRYTFQAAIATVFLSTIVLTAFWVS